MHPTLRSLITINLCLAASVAAVLQAASVPPSDNSETPYMGVYEWGFTTGANINRHDLAASWLARTDLWHETFAANGTWSDISGPGWLLDPVAWWLNQDSRRVCVLSVGMLPGPWDGSGPTSGPGAGTAVSLATGATGAYNSYFTTLAQNLVSRGMAGRTVIRLGWEFNGGWYTWRADTQAKGLNFAAYWRQIVTAMRAVPGASGLQFCWNGVNGWSAYSLADAYPGDAYVDYIGVDFYDQSWATNTYPYPTGATSAQILTRQQNAWTATAGTNDNGLAWWRDFAAAHDRPFAIPEWGLCNRSDNHGGLDNPYFIQKMYDFIQDPANDVAWHVYFDVDAPDGAHQVTPHGGVTSQFTQGAALYRELFAYNPWSGADIGSVGVAGSSEKHPSGVAVVTGSGAGFVAGGTSDAFRFLSRPLVGDGEIILRVDSTSATGAAQAGVMIRDGSAANARYVALYLSNGYCSFQYRANAGGASVRPDIASGVSAPRWLALRRRGAQVTAYQSADGAAWIYAGAVNTSIGSQAEIGIAVSGGASSTVNTVSISSLNLPVSVDLDNSASSGVTLTGSWTSSTTSPGFRGTNYLHDGNASKGSKSVTFSPTLPAAGTYRVLLNWTDATARATNVPVTITHANGTSQVVVNQQQAGQWRNLGVYTFAAGSAGSVTVSNAGTSSYVVADAVRFVACPPDIIVMDSSDASGVTLTGTWGASTSIPGFYGANYYYDTTPGTGSESVLYTPNIPASGTYRVYLNWGQAYSNRANNTPVLVTGSSGAQPFTVNQTQNGYWASLGLHTFAAGTSGTVRIGTEGTTGYVLADGVRFEAVTQAPAP